MDDVILEAGNSLLNIYADMHRDVLRPYIADIDTWKYMDTPYMEPEYYEQLVDILGAGNYTVVAGSNVKGSIRATMFISPTGVANAAKYLEAQRAAAG